MPPPLSGQSAKGTSLATGIGSGVGTGPSGCSPTQELLGRTTIFTTEAADIEVGNRWVPEEDANKANTEASRGEGPSPNAIV